MSDSRLGEIRYNTFGTPMKIVEYKNHGDITIEFLDQYKIKKNTTYSNFKIGQVRNPYDRNVKNTEYVSEYEEWVQQENEKAEEIMKNTVAG